jgi:ankyrin repeat protein
MKYEMCKEVLSHGANAETVFSDGTTPYLLACASGNVNLVRYLVEEYNIDVTSSMQRAGTCIAWGMGGRHCCTLGG